MTESVWLIFLNICNSQKEIFTEIQIGINAGKLKNLGKTESPSFQGIFVYEWITLVTLADEVKTCIKSLRLL